MQEYADFLARQFPFDQLDGDDLARLARQVEVEFFSPGATIVVAGGAPLDHLYVVRTGAVHLLDHDRVVDELGPGDTFGHLSMLRGLPPAQSAVAVGETLCYRLPDPRDLLEHPVQFAFGAAGSDRARLAAGGIDPALRPIADFMRVPLWAEPGTSMRDAARLMTEDNQSCILIRTPGGVGIMTDSDTRRWIARPDSGPTDPISALATVPARSVPATVTTSAAFVEMVTHGVHHLLVHDAAGAIIGVARVFDLSTAEIRDPLTVRAAIDRAQTLGDLVEASALLHPTVLELVGSGLSALRVAALLGAMIEAVVHKCVSLEPALADSTGPRPAWLVLGSLARSEPLPYSDVDSGLVWQNPDGPETAERLRTAAGRVIDAFERCGLRRCPDGANATNPLFSRSLEEWIGSVHRWVENPDQAGALLLSSIIADSRAITGLGVGRSLSEAISRLAANRRFARLMLEEALAVKPPTGFVRDFVVEANGRHRGELDLKGRGLRPVVGLGRWIAATTRTAVMTTDDRLQHGASAGLLSQDESDTLRGAYRDMYELLFGREVAAIAENRPVSTYLDPKDLDTLTRRHLRESFRAISKVQSRLVNTWALTVR